MTGFGWEGTCFRCFQRGKDWFWLVSRGEGLVLAGFRGEGLVSGGFVREGLVLGGFGSFRFLVTAAKIRHLVMER